MNDRIPTDGFSVIMDENGTVWLEHDEYGLLSPDLFNALMVMAANSIPDKDKCTLKARPGLWE